MPLVEPLRNLWRRLLAWDLLPTPGPEGARRDGPVERPWRYYWDHLPKRTAGADFSARDYQEARQRAEEVARTTLGDELWQRLMMDGYLDVPSHRYPGVTYRAMAAMAEVTPGLVQYYLPTLDLIFVAAIRRGAPRNLKRLV